MNRFKKSILVLILGGTSIFPMNSQAHPSETKTTDRCQLGSQYLAYPRPAYGLPQLTAAPEGYVPFHIEHYGRHGSRWLHEKDAYTRPVKILKKAKEKNNLTPDGLALLSELEALAEASNNRIGELTPLGHRQHREIARRMIANFPNIFVPGTYVDAKSTVVIRCILSMANEIAEMEAYCPELNVKFDASRTTQKLLAPNSTDPVAKELGKKANERAEKLLTPYKDHSAFLNKIFVNPGNVKKNKANSVFEDVFNITVNAQSHDGNYPDLYRYFTDEELYNEWICNNIWWYLNSGNTAITNNRVPYNQRTLLKNIIESADTAMVSPNQSVNLRFGHESIVLPLTILMGLNDSAYDTTDLLTLADHWKNYEIFPMASNIQIIFYRKDGALDPDGVLVKVLLNEEEARLPLDPYDGPYYKWTDVRQHLKSKTEI